MTRDLTKRFVLTGDPQPDALDIFVHLHPDPDCEFLVATGSEFLFTTDKPDSLPSLYARLRREFGQRRPITLHIGRRAPGIGEMLKRYDLITDQGRGRLAIIYEPEMPPPPTDPDQSDRELVRELMGE